jgi:Tfp pilus assembly protein PilN
MRPVNLIPPEDRRGDRAPLRAGSLSYVVIGAFAVGLVAVLAMVLTQNSITNHENEIAELEVARDAAAQRAEALAPYAEFASLQEQREQTIASLAQSRFDWERVLRELALVVPNDVTLDRLEATSAGEENATAAEGTTDTGGAPALVMSGCAASQDTVAQLVAALEDIDGVTRVGLENSAAGGAGSAGSTQAGSSQASEAGGCGDPKAPSFSLTAVFDNAVAEAAPVEPGAPPVTGDAGTVPAETNSTEEQVQESKQAANLVPGAAK